MKFKITTQGRPGKLTREQRVRQVLRFAKTSSEETYSQGGRKKEGHHKPRPSSWPKLKFMEGPDPE